MRVRVSHRYGALHDPEVHVWYGHDPRSLISKREASLAIQPPSEITVRLPEPSARAMEGSMIEVDLIATRQFYIKEAQASALYRSVIASATLSTALDGWVQLRRISKPERVWGSVRLDGPKDGLPPPCGCGSRSNMARLFAYASICALPVTHDTLSIPTNDGFVGRTHKITWRSRMGQLPPETFIFPRPLVDGCGFRESYFLALLDRALLLAGLDRVRVTKAVEAALSSEEQHRVDLETHMACSVLARIAGGYSSMQRYVPDLSFDDMGRPVEIDSWESSLAVRRDGGHDCEDMTNAACEAWSAFLAMEDLGDPLLVTLRRLALKYVFFAVLCVVNQAPRKRPGATSGVQKRAHMCGIMLPAIAVKRMYDLRPPSEEAAAGPDPGQCLLPPGSGDEWERELRPMLVEPTASVDPMILPISSYCRTSGAETERERCEERKALGNVLSLLSSEGCLKPGAVVAEAKDPSCAGSRGALLSYYSTVVEGYTRDYVNRGSTRTSRCHFVTARGDGEVISGVDFSDLFALSDRAGLIFVPPMPEAEFERTSRLMEHLHPVSAPVPVEGSTGASSETVLGVLRRDLGSVRSGMHGRPVSLCLMVRSDQLEQERVTALAASLRNVSALRDIRTHRFTFDDDVGQLVIELNVDEPSAVCGDDPSAHIWSHLCPTTAPTAAAPPDRVDVGAGGSADVNVGAVVREAATEISGVAREAEKMTDECRESVETIEGALGEMVKRTDRSLSTWIERCERLRDTAAVLLSEAAMLATSHARDQPTAECKEARTRRRTMAASARRRMEELEDKRLTTAAVSRESTEPRSPLELRSRLEAALTDARQTTDEISRWHLDRSRTLGVVPGGTAEAALLEEAEALDRRAAVIDTNIVQRALGTAAGSGLPREEKERWLGITTQTTTKVPRPPRAGAIALEGEDRWDEVQRSLAADGGVPRAVANVMRRLAVMSDAQYEMVSQIVDLGETSEADWDSATRGLLVARETCSIAVDRLRQELRSLDGIRDGEEEEEPSRFLLMKSDARLAAATAAFYRCAAGLPSVSDEGLRGIWWERQRPSVGPSVTVPTKASADGAAKVSAVAPETEWSLGLDPKTRLEVEELAHAKSALSNGCVAVALGSDDLYSSYLGRIREVSPHEQPDLESQEVALEWMGQDPAEIRLRHALSSTVRKRLVAMGREIERLDSRKGTSTTTTTLGRVGIDRALDAVSMMLPSDERCLPFSDVFLRLLAATAVADATSFEEAGALLCAAMSSSYLRSTMLSPSPSSYLLCSAASMTTPLERIATTLLRGFKRLEDRMASGTPALLNLYIDLKFDFHRSERQLSMERLLAARDASTRLVTGCEGPPGGEPPSPDAAARAMRAAISHLSLPTEKADLVALLGEIDRATSMAESARSRETFRLALGLPGSSSGATAPDVRTRAICEVRSAAVLKEAGRRESHTTLLPAGVESASDPPATCVEGRPEPTILSRGLERRRKTVLLMTSHAAQSLAACDMKPEADRASAALPDEGRGIASGIDPTDWLANTVNERTTALLSTGTPDWKEELTRVRTAGSAKAERLLERLRRTCRRLAWEEAGGFERGLERILDQTADLMAEVVPSAALIMSNVVRRFELQESAEYEIRCSLSTGQEGSYGLCERLRPLLDRVTTAIFAVWSSLTACLVTEECLDELGYATESVRRWKDGLQGCLYELAFPDRCPPPCPVSAVECLELSEGADECQAERGTSFVPVAAYACIRSLRWSREEWPAADSAWLRLLSDWLLLAVSAGMLLICSASTCGLLPCPVTSPAPCLAPWWLARSHGQSPPYPLMFGLPGLGPRHTWMARLVKRPRTLLDETTTMAASGYFVELRGAGKPPSGNPATDLLSEFCLKPGPVPGALIWSMRAGFLLASLEAVLSPSAASMLFLPAGAATEGEMDEREEDERNGAI